MGVWLAMPDIMLHLRELLDEHQAQLVQLEWLDISFDTIIPKRAREYTPAEVKKIKADIRSLDIALYYVKEGFMAHWQRGKDAICNLVSEPAMQQFDEWHDRVLLQLDRTIMQVDLINSEKWKTDEMVSFLEKVRISIHAFHQMVIEHIREEDSILQKVLTNVVA